MTVKREVVAQDVLGRVTRETLNGADASREEMLAFAAPSDPLADVSRIVEASAEWLAAKGWPDPRIGKVRLTADGWAALDGSHLPHGTRCRAALSYIEDRAGPLSPAAFTARAVNTGARLLAAHERGDTVASLRLALDLGQIIERAQMRRWLRHVELGKAYLDASATGAAMRRGTTEPHVLAALAEMDRLTSEGHSASRAAELAAERGIGASRSANLAAWNRRNRVERKL